MRCCSCQISNHKTIQPQFAEQVHAAQPLLVVSISLRLNLQATGWATRWLKFRSPPQHPCLIESGGARPGGIWGATPVHLSSQQNGVHLIEVPRRCIGPGKLKHLNGSGRGRHIERGPTGPCVSEKTKEMTPVPENSPNRAARAKSGSRPGADYLIPIYFARHSIVTFKFASQYRNFSP